MTLQDEVMAFKAMVEKHDLTYAYSDDHRYWVAGEASMKAIREAAAKLPRNVVVETWNAVVDKKIVAGAREQFYWTL